MKFLISLLLFTGIANADVIDLTSAEQTKRELAKPGAVVLLYYTDWCGACQEFKPVYKDLSNSMLNVRFYSMNSEKLMLKEHAGKVQYIPTVFVGKSDSDLRNNPCGKLNETNRDVPSLKRAVKECLNEN